MNIALFIKSILYCFSYKVIFSTSIIDFWLFSFIETKSLNIDLFTKENENKFKCHRGKVFQEKRKKLFLIRYY